MPKPVKDLRTANQSTCSQTPAERNTAIRVQHENNGVFINVDNCKLYLDREALDRITFMQEEDNYSINEFQIVISQVMAVLALSRSGSDHNLEDVFDLDRLTEELGWLLIILDELKAPRHML